MNKCWQVTATCPKENCGTQSMKSPSKLLWPDYSIVVFFKRPPFTEELVFAFSTECSAFLKIWISHYYVKIRQFISKTIFSRLSMSLSWQDEMWLSLRRTN